MRGDVGHARAFYEEALRLGGPSLDLLCNLGAACVALGDGASALRHGQAAVDSDPEEADAWNALGAAQLLKRRRAEALASFRRAVACDDAHDDALANLAAAAQTLGLWDEALTAAERAFALNPANARTIDQLLFLKLETACWDDLDHVVAAAAARIREGRPVAPFNMLSICREPGEMKRIGALQSANFSRLMAAAPTWTPRPRPSDGPIRVGFFSISFARHVNGYLIKETVERRDRERFVYTAICNDPPHRGGRAASVLDAFDDVVHLKDADPLMRVAQMRAADLDVAIDLDGFSSDGLPTPFAARVAPIQMRWIGYAGTSGARYYDYFIADKHVTPDDRRADFTEALLRLPRLWFPRDTRVRPAGSEIARAGFGLPETAFVFSAFNQARKFTPPMVAAWAAILRATPRSVLWMLESNGVATDNIRDMFKEWGVSADRLVISARTSAEAYLARHARADLALDTSPYNGHTMTSDALFMGTPVLTIRGQVFASRIAAGFLQALGLDDLVADDLADYARRAVALAQNPEKLNALRKRLDRAKEETRVFDGEAFARDFERGLLMVAERARAGLPPATINVPAG